MDPDKTIACPAAYPAPAVVIVGPDPATAVNGVGLPVCVPTNRGGWVRSRTALSTSERRVDAGILASSG